MKKYIIIALLCFYAFTVFAQTPLFTVKEVSKTTSDVDLTKTSIVDINSCLTVKISIPQLVAQLAENKKADPATTSKLQQLIFLLRNQDAILQKIVRPDPTKPLDAVLLAKYSALMDEFLSTLQRPEYSELRAAVNKFYQDGVNKGVIPQAYAIQQLALMMNDIIAGLEQTKDINTIQVQLVAFINTHAEAGRKVHIENFDNFTGGEYYNVPRWVTSFSDEDVQAFNTVAQLSTTLNKEIDNKFSDLVSAIPSSIKSYQCFVDLVKDFRDQLNTTEVSASEDVKAFVTSVKDKLGTIVAAMDDLMHQQNGGQNILAQFNNAGNVFISLAKSLPVTISDLKAHLTTAALQAFTGVKAAADKLDNCIDVLKGDIKTVENVYNIVTGLLQPFKSIAGASGQITGEVFNKTIGQLSATGYIDLKSTGKRANGDELVIKILSQPAGDASSSRPPAQTLDSRTIELQQIALYSETNIGVILASPIGSSKNVTLTNKFQFAPSGSIMVKFGSRTSRLWNTISPGLGFNLSTPDFNLDGSPDLSYGGVFTLFRNVLSVGLSYNTKTSSPFWFFGLSLPFSNLALPVGNIQTAKTNQ